MSQGRTDFNKRITKTKIDDSFPDAEFEVDSYHIWRADRNQHGGDTPELLKSPK
ncbi:hypothetical protein DPMN_047762 [Dreissena polymorpha]|uniref:Uncharacterized protein n=1 Tax=Dreissena polymorpha TaxID=45954 RepID=A0A9D4DAB5_DREPO|nr:hypothetical protein DPMN_047762 [Dreissena polymorpha]